MGSVGTGNPDSAKAQLGELNRINEQLVKQKDANKVN
jgi:hypothetical protein